MTDGQQPSSKWCFVCGVENQGGLHVTFFNDGSKQCFARVILGNTFQSYPGIAHGGILATLLDETMGRALLTEGDPINTPKFLFTARLEIRYNGTVAVEASATLVEIPPDKVQEMKSQDVGWQVYS
jgi:hypothetical protein